MSPRRHEGLHQPLVEGHVFRGDILTRTGAPPPASIPPHGRRERVTVSLCRSAGTGVHVSVRVGDQEHASDTWDALPRRLVTARDEFLRGFSVGTRRDRAGAERAALEANMAELGRALREVGLPGESGTARGSPGRPRSDGAARRTRRHLELLADSARRGRLLVTSRQSDLPARPRQGVRITRARPRGTGRGLWSGDRGA
jgi:hypothetical protein